MAQNKSKYHQLIDEYKNTHLEWFEKLYEFADGDISAIPWADGFPNPNLKEWINNSTYDFNNKTCCVIGCGLGDDAEYLAKFFKSVDALDISGNAISWCKKRYMASKVNYFVADLLEFTDKKYDFVFEAYTIQVLPDGLREKAIENLSGLLLKDGILLIIARGRDNNEAQSENPPYPLTRNELSILDEKMHLIQFEDFLDQNEESPVRRFSIQYINT